MSKVTCQVALEGDVVMSDQAIRGLIWKPMFFAGAPAIVTAAERGDEPNLVRLTLQVRDEEEGE